MLGLILAAKPGRLGVTEKRRATAALQFCGRGDKQSGILSGENEIILTIPFQY
jgi:hypothetical protein